MDSELDKLYYQKTVQLLKKEKNMENNDINILESAIQIKNMLRDGLSPSKLTKNERDIYLKIYDLKSLNKYSKYLKNGNK